MKRTCRRLLVFGAAAAVILVQPVSGCTNPDNTGNIDRNLDYCNPMSADPDSYCDPNEYCVPSLRRCRQRCKPDVRMCTFGSTQYDCMCPAQTFCLQDGETENYYCAEELQIACKEEADCQVTDRSFCGAFVCRNSKCVVLFDSTLLTTVPCDDRDPCTEGDQCTLKGYCLGTPKSCPVDPKDQCNVGICVDGTCDTTPRQNGVSCDDDLYCTTGDKCIDGLCVGDAKPPCKTSAECQVAICREPTTTEPAFCEASPVINGKICEDGVGCTKNKHCQEGTCVGEADDSLCENRKGYSVSCDATEGCIYEKLPDFTYDDVIEPEDNGAVVDAAPDDIKTVDAAPNPDAIGDAGGIPDSAAAETLADAVSDPEVPPATDLSGTM